MTLSDIERRDAKSPVFMVYLHTHTVWPTSIKFGMVTHVGRVVFVMGHAHPDLKGRGPSEPEFFKM